MSLRFVLVAACILAVPALPAYAADDVPPEQPFDVVSRTAAGEFADADVADLAVSADGSVFAFATAAGNLAAGDTAGRVDVFRRAPGESPVLISRGAAGPGNGDSRAPALSSDGRFVVFGSYATDLVTGDTNGRRDVFRYDALDGSLVRVSLGAANAQATGGDSAPVGISADGSLVTFRSAATNLVPGDTNKATDVFQRNLTTGTTVRVSLTIDGQQANGGSSAASVSSDGRYVAFQSAASNLYFAWDNNGLDDVWVRDVVAGSTDQVSAGYYSNDFPDAAAVAPSISADGTYVSWTTAATDAYPRDTNGVSDVLTRSRGSLSRVSIGNLGEQPDGASSAAWTGSTGQYTAFTSAAGNLVAGDTDGAADVFVHDVWTNATIMVSAAGDPELPATASGGVLGGSVVGFLTASPALVSDSAPVGVRQVVARDLTSLLPASDVSPPDTGYFGPAHVYSKEARVPVPLAGQQEADEIQCRRRTNAEWTEWGWGICTDFPVQGTYQVEMRAVDRLGNADPTPDPFKVTVDWTAPAKPGFTLPAGPVRLAAARAKVTWETGTRLHCRVNSQPWTTSNCDGDFQPYGLRNGTNTVYVKAIDATGNVSPVASRSIVVDSKWPVVRLVKPVRISSDRTPTFRFVADESGVKYACRVDGRSFSRCASPHTTAKLAKGKHVFRVRATDRVGNVGPVTSYTFTVR